MLKSAQTFAVVYFAHIGDALSCDAWKRHLLARK